MEETNRSNSDSRDPLTPEPQDPAPQKKKKKKKAPTTGNFKCILVFTTNQHNRATIGTYSTPCSDFGVKLYKYTTVIKYSTSTGFFMIEKYNFIRF